VDETGAVMPGARLVLSGLKGSSTDRARARAVSAAKGEFTLHHLAAGRNSLLLSAESPEGAGFFATQLGVNKRFGFGQRAVPANGARTNRQGEIKLAASSGKAGGGQGGLSQPAQPSATLKRRVSR
jgi:hypothetical protein